MPPRQENDFLSVSIRSPQLSDAAHMERTSDHLAQIWTPMTFQLKKPYYDVVA
jgi:hypothetical protein